MDNTLLVPEKTQTKTRYIPCNPNGRPKGSRNKKTVLLEQYIIPQAIKTLESIPKSIRDKYKDAMAWKGLTTMEQAIDTVDCKEKPELKFSMAARIYDLTAPKIQNINVESRSTVIRSQDMLEALKMRNINGLVDAIDTE